MGSRIYTLSLPISERRGADLWQPNQQIVREDGSDTVGLQGEGIGLRKCGIGIYGTEWCKAGRLVNSVMIDTFGDSTAPLVSSTVRWR